MQFPVPTWLYSQWAELVLSKPFSSVSCLQIFIITFSCYFLGYCIYPPSVSLQRFVHCAASDTLFPQRMYLLPLLCARTSSWCCANDCKSHSQMQKCLVFRSHLLPLLPAHDAPCKTGGELFTRIAEVKHKSFPKLYKSLIRNVGFINTSVTNKIPQFGGFAENTSRYHNMEIRCVSFVTRSKYNMCLI